VIGVAYAGGHNLRVIVILGQNTDCRLLITSSMARFIFLIALICLTGSCNQNPRQDKHLAAPTDTLKNALTETDTTEIDFVRASPDQAKILMENEYVRVIQYSLKPGEKDNPHTHPPKTSYVISGGTLRVYSENEKPVDFEEVTGASEWSGRIGKHYVENIGGTTVTILLTEVKSAR
jgi:quercetin dioxygenase-like cupin family protein